MSEITKFLIFAAIGLFNSILDILIWKFLVTKIQKSTSLTSFVTKIKLNAYSFSHSISFVITVISSYILNKTFTFGKSFTQNLNQTTVEATKFFGVAIFSWVLTTLFLNYLTKSDRIKTIVTRIGEIETNLTKKPSLVLQHWPLFAKILTIAVSMVTNYTGYRLFVF
jgi:putative flippase GtrA